MERLAAMLTDLAVRYVDPDAVLLFGSMARGHGRVDSDVDLLIIGSFEGHPARRGLELREALSEVPVHVDLLFMTPAEYAEQLGRSGSFVQTVSRHARLLYIRAGSQAPTLHPEGRAAGSG